jgi:hypothetical protein
MEGLAGLIGRVADGLPLKDGVIFLVQPANPER